MRTRLIGLRIVLRQQPYEAAFGVACLSGMVQLVTGRGSASASRVVPHWALHILGGIIVSGGLLTLAGLVLSGVVADEVRRVVARRLEQSGQTMISGVLLVLGVSALSFGAAGAVNGGVYLALCAATAVRAVVIAATYRAAGRTR